MIVHVLFSHCWIVPALLVLTFWLAPVLVAEARNNEKEGKAPKWLREAEIYALWYRDLAAPEEIERYKSFPLIDWGQPASNLKWAQEFHNLGIRSIAYVSFYKAPDIPKVEDRRRWEGGSPGIDECKKNPFWQSVDLSQHPEWVLIAKDGSLKRPFDNPDYPPGWYQVCTNVEGYTEAALEGVKGIMEMGFDGLFIDNVHPDTCFALEHDKHKHIYPDKNNKETYEMLLAQVQSLVKSYGPDKVCVLNSGGLREAYGQYGDGLMWESYIFGGGKRRHDWALIRQAADKWKPYIDSGKTILALSYTGGKTEEERKKNAFYSYACAKLSGFLWSGSLILDKVRIGMPVGYIKAEDGVHYRLYQRGLVAVNPADEEREAHIQMDEGSSKFLDLYSNEVLSVKEGKLSILIPSDAGRVYLLP